VVKNNTANVVENNTANVKNPHEKVCENCGENYTYKIHNQRFCCDDCRYQFHNFTPKKAKK
jgi:protein-arginine kinase activator protein McsA